jgi:hypothetical protein
MSPIVIFIIEQVLPWVLSNLPAILKFLQENHPTVYNQTVNTVVKHAKDQGPDFDWHSGP